MQFLVTFCQEMCRILIKGRQTKDNPIRLQILGLRSWHENSIQPLPLIEYLIPCTHYRALLEIC